MMRAEIAPELGETHVAPRDAAAEPGFRMCVLIALAYSAVMGAASIQRYRIFGDGGDLVDYMQMLWNTAHGHILHITNVDSAGSSFRGGHIEPILIIVAFVYRLLPDPITLLVLQTVALAVGGPLVYCIARVHGNRQVAAVLLSIFYFLIPHVQYTNMHEFHPDCLAVPLLLTSFLAFDTRHWRILAVCLTLALMVKEQMPLFVLGLGAYWWHWRGNRRAGIAVLIATALYVVLIMAPWYLATANQFSHDYSGFFGGSSGGSGGVLDHARQMVSSLGDSSHITNIVLALAPTGFIFIFDSSAIVIAAPLLGLFLGNAQINDIWWHHYVTLVPTLVYGTSHVLARPGISRRGEQVILALVGCSALFGIIFAEQPIDLMHWVVQPSTLNGTAHSDAQAAFLRFVPPDVALAADPALATHLANREYLYKLYEPKQVTYVPYVVLDLHSDVTSYPRAFFIDNKGSKAALAYMRSRGGFTVVRADHVHGLYLYANCGDYPREMGCGPR